MKGYKLRLPGLSPLLNQAREAWGDEILFWAGEPMPAEPARGSTLSHSPGGDRRVPWR